MAERAYTAEATYQQNLSITISAESEEAAESRLDAVLSTPGFDYHNPPEGVTVAVELGAGEWDIHGIYPEDDGEEEEDLPDED